MRELVTRLVACALISAGIMFVLVSVNFLLIFGLEWAGVSVASIIATVFIILFEAIFVCSQLIRGERFQYSLHRLLLSILVINPIVLLKFVFPAEIDLMEQNGVPALLGLIVLGICTSAFFLFLSAAITNVWSDTGDAES